MATRETRKYQSPTRTRLAGETRERILSAAKKLFHTRGYEGAAIDAIAAKAGVSSPTIYAVFGSKQAILKELVYSVKFGQRYQDAVEKVLSTTDPKKRLRLVGAVARSVHETTITGLHLFRGAGVVSPEIAALEKEGERRRYELQKPVIDLLFQKGAIRAGISEKKARDILWCLTGHEIYRMLVMGKGWTSDEYEEWLGELLLRALL